MEASPSLRQLITESGKPRAFIFLDYDGTLAPFAPNPDVVLPDTELHDLLSRLAAREELRVAVVSGRRLAHVQALAPLPGLWLAGSYGLEMVSPDGSEIQRLDYIALRPGLEALKPRWQALLKGRQGFYLEDKGWSLAIHARRADSAAAKEVLALAGAMEAPSGFQLEWGELFLEACPPDAKKGPAIEYILQREGQPDLLPVFLGDDDKDESGFAAIAARGGVGIMVAGEARPSHARYRLPDPHAVRRWLADYLS